MLSSTKIVHINNKGSVLIVSMILIVVCSALAVSLAAMSSTNIQLASNQQKIGSALTASQSGLEVGKYLVNGYSLSTSTITTNIGITQQNRDATWQAFRTYIPSHSVDGATWTYSAGTEDLISSDINFGGTGEKFRVKYHYDGNNITLESTGIISTGDVPITKKTTVDMNIRTNGDILKYAVATRSRMWLTGDSTVHGDVYSAWNLSKTQLAAIAANPNALAAMNAPNMSPFNVTSDSTVEGTINICWSKEQIENKSWQLETLDADGNPMYDLDGNKIISPEDEIQGTCEGINYGVPPQNMAGMSISDYDTTTYYNATRTANGGNGDIPSPAATQYYGNDASLLQGSFTSNGTKWRYEYFPHAANNYTQDRPGGGGLKVKRYIYKNQTFDNVTLPKDKNALFINCTFDGVLYVDSGKTTSNYNNVRFDSCTFNGMIASNTPQTFNWQKNTLYYTGSATFQNDASAEATILAPHFNVNLGNTNSVAGTDNVLHGAIVGGIVDVRGNAEVFGTIISMADTSSYTSGYVTNIGATLDDGGSETVSIGDVGVINITPDEDKMLPSGIMTHIVIKPSQGSYSEG